MALIPYPRVSSKTIALAQAEAVDIIRTRSKCGCSSVVEHLLAKEDVASSSLVTRSIPTGIPLCEGPSPEGQQK